MTFKSYSALLTKTEYDLEDISELYVKSSRIVLGKPLVYVDSSLDYWTSHSDALIYRS